MTATRGGSGSGSGSSSRAGCIDDQMWEIISSEIKCSILEQNLVIFGTIKKGIMEILDECMGAFHYEMVGAQIMTF